MSQTINGNKIVCYNFAKRVESKLCVGQFWFNWKFANERMEQKFIVDSSISLTRHRFFSKRSSSVAIGILFDSRLPSVIVNQERNNTNCSFVTENLFCELQTCNCSMTTWSFDMSNGYLYVDIVYICNRCSYFHSKIIYLL